VDSVDGQDAEVVMLVNVLYVSNGLVPIVEYRGVRFGIPFHLMEPGTDIRRPGDRGTIVLKRVVAEWMGLPENPYRGPLKCTGPLG
jgi:hypothetical protein